MDAEKTGRLIAALRKEKNMTQQQLAEQLYVSDKAVSRWETGRGFPEITVLENIADILGVSVAEIIKGEKIEGTISADEMTSITDESIRMSKKYVEQKRNRNILSGFLAGVILLITVITHLNSPVYFNDPDEIMKIRESDDHMIVAILDEKVAGYEIEDVTDEEGENTGFISCYSTKMYEWFKKKEKKIALLSEDEKTNIIFYYPSGEADEAIWSKDGKQPSYGVVTLPRLIYNYWILLAGVCSVIGIAASLLLKNRYHAKIVMKFTLIPVSLLISMILILSGHFKEIYNAAYYFSGILLLGAVIYVFLISLIDQKKKQKMKE